MSGCVWSANHLPHTAHGDCAGLLPHLAEGLQRLMDWHAARGRETPAERVQGEAGEVAE